MEQIFAGLPLKERKKCLKALLAKHKLVGFTS